MNHPLLKYIYLLIFLVLYCSCNSKQEKRLTIADEDTVEHLQEQVENVKKERIEVSSLEKELSKEGREAFTPTPFIAKILSQLQLKPIEVYEELIAQKEMPYDVTSTIVVIPKIASLDEDGYSFSLDSYILVVDSVTGEIKQKYYESNDTNGWDSDAVRIAEISIDTANYSITEDIRAFGIKLYYIGSSKPNPYSSTTLSLFIEEGKGLKKILNSYEIGSYGGEWDMQCSGEFIEESKVLIMDASKTNGYYDILVNMEGKIIVSVQKGEDDCEETITKETSKQTLKYNDDAYEVYKKVYTLETESACGLEIVLEGEQYHLKTDKRQHRGTFSIEEGYITFVGLESDEPGREVQGSYDDHEIVIQNYGNAMNPFTIFEECADQKYLRLTRK